MQIIDDDLARTLLLEEYPILDGRGLAIARRFRTADGREFNTFLVESKQPGLERFIAKGVVHQEYGSLELEWKVLARLQASDVPAPKLLVPQHRPRHYLLIEYIEGTSAADAMDVDDAAGTIFAAVGTTIGKLHQIPVEHFGGLLHAQPTSWSDYLETKITRRLDGIKQLIGPELYAGARQLFLSCRPAIEQEGRDAPRLIHRDVYLDNFILRQGTDEAVLIDYGMAMGGRPLYDLAKLYMLELYRAPSQRDTFLAAYAKHMPLPEDFHTRMRMYILQEALGMIHFLDRTGQAAATRHAIGVLGELTANTGVIARLLE